MISHDHSQIILQSIPVGLGSFQTIEVVLEGVASSVHESTLFTYTELTALSVDGCEGDGVSCDLTGNQQITIYGENFGPSSNDNLYVEITDGVNGGECTNAAHVGEAGTQITCNTPAGKGLDIPIFISLLGDSNLLDTGLTIDYRGPVVTSNTLQYNGGSATTALTLPSVDANVLTISGTGFQPDVTKEPVLTYGPTGMEYTAIPVDFTDTSLTFTLADPSVGQDLVFVVYDTHTDQHSAPSSGTLTFDLPEFIDGSLRLICGVEGSEEQIACDTDQREVTGHSTVTGQSMSGDVVEMQIKNVGDNKAFMTIMSGNNNDFIQ
jgi:hypothetical protein